MRSTSLAALLFALFAVSSAQAQTETTSGKVFWKGEVDNKVQLVIRGLTLDQRTVEGDEKPAGNHSFTAPLPQQAVTVGVNRREGRNKVSVIQQPTADNNFTAIVEIHDDDGGSRDYLLEIFWQVS